MEQVGSSEQVNVVVQWGSIAEGTTKRLHIQKDNQPTVVSSPVLENMGRVDMGDWKELVAFIRWGAERFPAKKYFVSIWDHGAGWHDGGTRGAPVEVRPFDISWDEETNHHITTQQLGQALARASSAIGRKIDILGTDACLMSMIEVAAEISDTASIMVGSEEVEPGAAWPYHTFLAVWTANPRASAAEVSRLLVDTYVDHYKVVEPDSRWKLGLSALDLSRTDQVIDAFGDLSREVLGSGRAALRAVHSAMGATEFYDYPDSRDLIDFVSNLKTRESGVSSAAMGDVEAAVRSMVIANRVVDPATRAQGLAIWLPTKKSSTNFFDRPYTFDRHSAAYRKLRFHRETSWGDALEKILVESAAPVTP